MRGFSGRTGRFGRKGILINFVHNKKTWTQMEAIEKSTGKAIICIETTDLDVIEEVHTSYLVSILVAFIWTYDV